MSIDLNVVWFLLVGILFSGFFFLEGFDYGVGILAPFLGKSDNERRQAINTIGPHWDGNEVWLITAGGAMFAAFPNWYATLFSGFYLALFLMLVALIIRAVAFEIRSKDKSPHWRAVWDWGIFFGSTVPALLWGVAFANIVRGVPIDASMNYVGGFFNLLNPYALLGGLVTLGLFVLHGALFLQLKTEGILADRAYAVAKTVVVPVIVGALAFVGFSVIETEIFDGRWLPVVAAVLSAAALVVTAVLIWQKRSGLSFAGSGLAIVFVSLMLFAGLFPNVMPSSLDAAYTLTIYNASSSPYTLRVMTIVALIFVPIVLGYQGWSYWVFRQRITSESELEY